MAHRSRPSTANSMLDHRARPGPTPHDQEPENEDVELPLESYVPTGLELATMRPESPTPEQQECHNHSPDGDSSSDYVNNTSEEEDYDEGLPEEEEGITYYIRYCPEDDSYLEGMDCNGEEYVAHGTHPVDTDECQEAVEEWTDSASPHPLSHGAEDSQDYPDDHLPIPEDEPSALEAQDQEEGGHYCPSKDGYQDYYPSETNGNAGNASPYRPRRGDGDLEDQEEDIDQIVAEIKMSLSMTSITSVSEASPEHMPELGPGDSTEACVPGEASHGPNRHEARPKSLNLPPEAKHPGDLQRGFKTKIRTPEERPKWTQEQVGGGCPLGREQGHPMSCAAPVPLQVLKMSTSWSCDSRGRGLPSGSQRMSCSSPFSYRDCREAQPSRQGHQESPTGAKWQLVPLHPAEGLGSSPLPCISHGRRASE